MSEYFLVAHFNPKHKLVYISTHIKGTKTDPSVKTCYSKAKYAYKLFKNGRGGRAAAKAFDSGLCCALINTGLDGWEDRYFNRRFYSKEEAVKLRARLYNVFEESGYTVAGSRSHLYKDKSDSGIDNWGKKLPSPRNLKKEQIVRRIEQMTLGLKLSEDMQKKIVQDVYMYIVLENKNRLTKYGLDPSVSMNYWGDVFTYIHSKYVKPDPLPVAA